MNEFQQILRDLIMLFEELTAIETVKLNAGRSYHMAAIEECITKEQAAIMRLRGLEKAREKKQEELGFGGMRFREILEQVPEDTKEELLPLFDTFSRQIQMFQEVSDDTLRIIEINKRQLEKTIEGREGQIYGSTANRQSQEKHMADKNI